MHPETAAELCRCIFTAEMTGAEKLICGSPFGRRLLMAVDAVPCGRGDGRRQAMIQPALVATLRTDRATVTAGDAAGDLPGPPGEGGVPCGGRDAAGDLPGPPGEAGVPCGGRNAGATPFAEGVTTGGQPCPVAWGAGQPWVLRVSSGQSNMRRSRRERAIGSQCMSAPSASVNGTSTLGPGRAS